MNEKSSAFFKTEKQIGLYSLLYSILSPYFPCPTLPPLFARDQAVLVPELDCTLTLSPSLHTDHRNNEDVIQYFHFKKNQE